MSTDLDHHIVRGVLYPVHEFGGRNPVEAGISGYGKRCVGAGVVIFESFWPTTYFPRLLLQAGTHVWLLGEGQRSAVPDYPLVISVTKFEPQCSVAVNAEENLVLSPKSKQAAVAASNPALARNRIYSDHSYFPFSHVRLRGCWPRLPLEDGGSHLIRPVPWFPIARVPPTQMADINPQWPRPSPMSHLAGSTAVFKSCGRTEPRRLRRLSKDCGRLARSGRRVAIGYRVRRLGPSTMFTL